MSAFKQFAILLFLFLLAACQGPSPERVRIARLSQPGRAEMIPPSDALAKAMESVLKGVRLGACGTSYKEGENSFYFLDMQGDKDDLPVRLGIVLEEGDGGLYLPSATCLHQCSPDGPNPCRGDCKQMIKVPCEDNLCHCSGSGECYEAIFKDQHYDLRPIEQLINQIDKQAE